MTDIKDNTAHIVVDHDRANDEVSLVPCADLADAIVYARGRIERYGKLPGFKPEDIASALADFDASQRSLSIGGGDPSARFYVRIDSLIIV